MGQASAAYDVTDDGSVVVGAYNNKPAFWQNGTWTELPMPIADGVGGVFSVTPDGSKMVGRVFASSWASGEACLWVNGELVEVNHAQVDRFGDDAYFNEMIDISADGNTMLGCLNYVVLPNRTAFIMQNGEYFEFGSEYYDPQSGGNQYNFYDFPNMSPNGKWITGDIYWVEGGGVEYWCPFRYDVDNNITELFLDDDEVASFASDNEGNLFGVTPLNFPIREALLLKDGSWVSLDQEILDTYGLNVGLETGYEKLGNVFGVSANGKVIVGCNGVQTYNWVLKLPDPSVNIKETNAVANGLKAMMKGSRLAIQGRVSHVTLINQAGIVVMDQKVYGFPVFDLSHLSAGVYIVVMTDENQQLKSDKIWVGIK